MNDCKIESLFSAWRHNEKIPNKTGKRPKLASVSEPPDADPPKGLIRITVLYLERHVRWCGERERKAPVYAIIKALKFISSPGVGCLGLLDLCVIQL